MAPRVLDGIKIIDFTRHMAGPYATVMLADHGADVVKVENLPKGDTTRGNGVHFVDGESALFLLWNRGKRSLAVNMRDPDGLTAVLRLIEQADVVIENYRPGVAEKIGIGYERLAQLNPRLIYCGVSAFGSSGPMSQYPGTDPVVQATSGIMSVTGEQGGDPLLVGVPTADFTGAMMAMQGILLALLARERTGRGQKVDVGMLHGMLWMHSTRLAEFWATGENPDRHGSAHSALIPYQAFRTADGAVMAGAWGARAWTTFCEALGADDLVDDERFSSNVKRQEHQAELVETLSERFAKKTTADWEPRFRQAGALFAPVNSFSEIFEHPHIREAGFVRTVDHATLGPINALGPPFDLSEHTPWTPLPPPLLGQHTTEVLGEYGFSEAEVTGLLESGVVQQWQRDQTESTT